MTNTKSWTAKALTIMLALLLCGGPQLLEAQSAPSQQPQSSPQTRPSDGGMVNPAQGPLEPVAPPAQAAPQAPPAPTASQPETVPEAPAPQTQTEPPVGAAVGQAGTAAGGPASNPAGTAIAPTKQRQTRSLFLKVGAIAAAGAAIGVVYALTRGTPSNPPGVK
jgi:hypothetical protein